MTRAVLSIGSNIGDRTAHLQTAVTALGRSVRAVSSIYRTPPWGGVEQDDFYNIVVIAEDAEQSSAQWLQRCQELERAAGRERLVHWGPRTLDADVIAVELHGHPIISEEPDLLLPHPRAAERAFVLVPWAEIDPTAVLPGAGPIADLIEDLDIVGITRVGHVR